MAKNNLYLKKVIRDYESRQYYYNNRHRNFYNSCDSINSFENFNETENANEYFIQLQDELKRKEKKKKRLNKKINIIIFLHN